MKRLFQMLVAVVVAYWASLGAPVGWGRTIEDVAQAVIDCVREAVVPDPRCNTVHEHLSPVDQASFGRYLELPTLDDVYPRLEG